MTINSNRIFQLFKYAVYALLAMNIYWFFIEEYAAAPLRFPGGVGLAHVRDAYAATIDTAAWVVLLLMFELETYVLEDHHYTRRVTVSLHLLRAACYVFIIYSFWGYLERLLFLFTATPLSGVTQLCDLVADNWTYAVDVDEYVPLTPENCVTLSSATEFIRYEGLTTVADPQRYVENIRLAWVDVINSAVWLGVVLLLEIDVRLQELGKLDGLALRVSTILKYVFYSTLLVAAVYWGVKGDFVDFWDAFLWLVAFFFIEMNVFEWRRESQGVPSGATQAV